MPVTIRPTLPPRPRRRERGRCGPGIFGRDFPKPAIPFGFDPSRCRSVFDFPCVGMDWAVVPGVKHNDTKAEQYRPSGARQG